MFLILHATRQSHNFLKINFKTIKFQYYTDWPRIHIYITLNKKKTCFPQTKLDYEEYGDVKFKKKNIIIHV